MMSVAGCPQVRALYGSSAYSRRERLPSPSGVWFAVMFAMRGGEEEQRHDDRVRLTCTSHIGSLFMCDARERCRASAPPIASSAWRIILALGPLRGESDADSVCRLWSLDEACVMSRVARAEVISIRFGISGFVDWDSIFGRGARLSGMYRLEFRANPCDDGGERDGGGAAGDDRARKRRRRKNKRDAREKNGAT